MFEILWALLLSTIRLLALEAMWCEAAAAVMERYPESRVPFVVTEPVLQVAMAGEDVIVVSGVSSDRRLVRSTPHHEIEELMPRTQRLPMGGEYLFARGSRWWYGLAGSRHGVRGTYFVSDDGSSSVVPTAGRGPLFWLPLNGDVPRALEVSDGDEGLLATEIAAGGPLRTWHLPFPLGRLTSAEYLPDGRIAVVTQHRESGRVTILLLADDDHIDIRALGYKMAIQLATAIDSSGRLAIATATMDRRVDGAVVDPTRAADPKWRELRRGIRLQGGTGELQVTPVSDGFVVAWINRSESPPRLESGNLRAGSAGGFFTIGDLLERKGGETFFSLRSEDGEPVFIRDDGVHILTRRLPASVIGFDLIRRLSARWCGRA